MTIRIQCGWRTCQMSFIRVGLRGYPSRCCIVTNKSLMLWQSSASKITLYKSSFRLPVGEGVLLRCEGIQDIYIKMNPFYTCLSRSTACKECQFAPTYREIDPQARSSIQYVDLNGYSTCETVVRRAEVARERVTAQTAGSRLSPAFRVAKLFL